ncbi:hypothetical protein N8575_02065 [Gammaproteobacteria bacterium]|nr:hypothetical protein [Gammaproteobacteria bacterium]
MIEAADARIGQLVSIGIALLVLLQERFDSRSLGVMATITFASITVNLVQGVLQLGGFAVIVAFLFARLLYRYGVKEKAKLTTSVLLNWAFALAFLLFGFLQTGVIAGFINGSHNHVNTLLIPYFAIAGAVFLNSSSNTTVFKCTEVDRQGQLIFFTLSITSLFIMMMLTGRSGVVLASIGVIALLLSIKSITTRLVTISIVILLVYKTWNSIFLFLSLTSGGVIKFMSENLGEDIRWLVLDDWLNTLFTAEAIFGVERNYFLTKYGIGSHNSIIQLHETLGWLGIILISLIVIRQIISMTILRDITLMILTSLVWFRFFTDSVFNSVGMLTSFWFLYFCIVRPRFGDSSLVGDQHGLVDQHFLHRPDR